MRPGGGKAKGAEFERDICRQLSLWVSRGKQEDVYWRSAMSGGRSTVAHKKGKRLAAQAGDISCIHSVGQLFADKFFIECKDYRDLNFIGLLKGRGNLVEFWCDTVLASEKYKKLPFLVAHQSRQPIIVCTNAEGLSLLHPLPIKITVPPLGLFMILFEDFLRNDVPHHF